MLRISGLAKIVRGDVHRIPRVVLFSITSISLYNFGLGFTEPFFSLYLSSFFDQLAIVGALNTLGTFAGILILLPLGALLDRVRHDKIMIIAKLGYVFAAVLFFVAGEVGAVSVLLVALILQGMLIPTVWTTASATLRDYSHKRDAAVMYGLFESATHLLWILGLGMALLIVWQFPLHYIFLPMMILPLLSIALNVHPDEHHHQSLRKGVQKVFTKDKVVKHFFRTASKWRSEVLMMLALVGVGALVPLIGITFVPLYAAEQGFSVDRVGVLVLIANLSFLLSFFSGEISDRAGYVNNIVVGFFVSAMALFSLAFATTSMGIFASTFLFTAGYALFFPAIQAVITSLISKKHTGIASAAVHMCMLLSVAVASPIIGVLIDVLTWKTSFFIWATVFLFTSVVSLLVAHLLKKRKMLYDKTHQNDQYSPYLL